MVYSFEMKKTKAKTVYKRSSLEKSLERQLRAKGLKWIPEYQFTSDRKWRLDFAFPSLKIGAEVHGGTWHGGRHTRGAGFDGDCEKHNAACLLGWTVLKFTSRMVADGTAAAQIEQIIKAKS